MLTDFRGSENSPSIPRAGVSGSGARLRRLAEGGSDKESTELGSSAECAALAVAPLTASDAAGVTDQQQQTDELVTSEWEDQAPTKPSGDLERALETVGVQIKEGATPLTLGSTTVETGQQQQPGEHGGAQMEDLVEDVLSPLSTSYISMALRSVRERISRQHAQLLLAFHEESAENINWRKLFLLQQLKELDWLNGVAEESGDEDTEG
ncbi:UNVERIFIED_CONTAM: hypothetical protein HHA_214420 [Hammondia hammondi]|eukprot:XP_008886745.1 hypothetical protein HHA_214420 [Hammondia hammondi]